MFILLRSWTFSFEILHKKEKKSHKKNHIICVKHAEQTVKGVEMHNFFVCAYKSQDCMQSQEKFEQWKNNETVTYKNLHMK